MEHCDIIIIGAGVIGLAISDTLSKYNKEIILVEQHPDFGRETSSRNSEVIHAGIYYPTDSLKARLCVEGSHLLYELCENHTIPYKRTGKIIVSNSDEENLKLHELLNQGTINGVKSLELISSSRARELEPHIKCCLGLYSPDTGIINSHELMHYYEQSSQRSGVTIAYNCYVQGIEKDSTGYIIEILDADGEVFQLHSEIVINSAGLHSDKLAELCGIDLDKNRYRLHPCKGEYFSVSNRHHGKVSHLIYPAPSKISLGLHAVVELDSRLKLGPNAFYVDNFDYSVDESHRKDFYDSASRYLDFIELEDLQPDQSGIRPKLQQSGETFRDFVISEEQDKGYPGFINLIGIESPGLTAAPAIAKFVKGLLF